jgi:hypothetical protein
MTQLSKYTQHFLGLPSTALNIQPQEVAEQTPAKRTRSKMKPHRRQPRKYRTFSDAIFKKVHQLKKQGLTYKEIFLKIKHRLKKESTPQSMAHSYREWLDSNADLNELKEA